MKIVHHIRHEKKSSTTHTHTQTHTHTHTHTPFNFAKSDQWISPRSEDTRVTQMVTPLNKHVQRTRRNARTTGKHRPGLISRMPKEKLAIPFIFFLWRNLRLYTTCSGFRCSTAKGKVKVTHNATAGGEYHRVFCLDQSGYYSYA